MTDKIAHSISETAHRIGVSRSFLYLEIKNGKLATIKVGKRRLVRVEDEAAYLAAHYQSRMHYMNLATRAASCAPAKR